MKGVKYLGAACSVLLGAWMLPYTYLIALSLVLVDSTFGELVYLLGRLFIYIGVIVVLGMTSAKLYKGARG